MQQPYPHIPQLNAREQALVRAAYAMNKPVDQTIQKILSMRNK